MVVALDPDGCFDHVLAREVGLNGEATTWRLAFLKGRELDALTALVARADGKVESLDDAELVLSLGLRGWKNFRDKAGQDVPFPPRVEGTVFGVSCRVASPEAMARLPLTPSDVLELLQELVKASGIGAEAAKKSPSPQP